MVGTKEKGNRIAREEMTRSPKCLPRRSPQWDCAWQGQGSMEEACNRGLGCQGEEVGFCSAV